MVTKYTNYLVVNLNINKMGQLALLPQGQPERNRRAIGMVDQMDAEGFGACTNHYECESACPKSISVKFISRMNRDYMKAKMTEGKVTV
jgi:succinate dehydrogenase iron-sulfur subunit